MCVFRANGDAAIAPNDCGEMPAAITSTGQPNPLPCIADRADRTSSAYGQAIQVCGAQPAAGAVHSCELSDVAASAAQPAYVGVDYHFASARSLHGAVVQSQDLLAVASAVRGLHELAAARLCSC